MRDPVRRRRRSSRSPIRRLPSRGRSTATATSSRASRAPTSSRARGRRANGRTSARGTRARTRLPGPVRATRCHRRLRRGVGRVGPRRDRATLAPSAEPRRSTRVHRWPRGMPQYVMGSLERLAVIERRLAEHPASPWPVPPTAGSASPTASPRASRPRSASSPVGRRWSVRVDRAPHRDARVAARDGAGGDGGGRAARARSRRRDRAAVHAGRPRRAAHVRRDRRPRHLRERDRAGACATAASTWPCTPRRTSPAMTCDGLASPPVWSAPTRAMRGSARPGRGTRSRSARASRRRRCGAARSCSACDPTCRSSRSAATSTRASASGRSAASTPSSWPPPASTGSVWPTEIGFRIEPGRDAARVGPGHRRAAGPRGRGVARGRRRPRRHRSLALRAERAVTRALAGGCTVPVAAHAARLPTAAGGCSPTPTATASSRSSRQKVPIRRH